AAAVAPTYLPPCSSLLYKAVAKYRRVFLPFVCCVCYARSCGFQDVCSDLSRGPDLLLLFTVATGLQALGYDFE
ncbi:hypothetical protein KI387_002147, partial [Taxus chinensis]